jgi:tetratricopeptide (TPR) repeat protein
MRFFTRHPCDGRELEHVKPGIGTPAGRGDRRSLPSAVVRLVAVVALLVALASTACGTEVDPAEALARGLREQTAGNLDSAAEAYVEVLEVQPRNKFANYNLGVIEQERGRVELAEGYYRAALDTDPNFEPALYNLAIVRTQVGVTQEAIDLYGRAIAVSPSNADAHFNLSLLLQSSGQAEEALRHLQRAIRLDPTLASRLPAEPIVPDEATTPRANLRANRVRSEIPVR